ncbi:MAG: hypothetical protein LC739_06490, partial [Actinobacteria bacterium]|nr:hypothetical protein [Actinomycetota bacterium]
TAPTPEGMRMPMMAMVAMVVRSESLAVGWVYHLFNSAVIGALFGLLLGGRIGSLGAWSAIWSTAPCWERHTPSWRCVRWPQRRFARLLPYSDSAAGSPRSSYSS